MSEIATVVTKLTLREKLIALSNEMGALHKGGKNSAQNYKYAKGEDAMKQLREMEVKLKFKVLPSIIPGSYDIREKGSSSTTNGTTTVAVTGFITSFMVKYAILDGESNEQLDMVLPVQGYDMTDKGVYKALTGGMKYFILQLASYTSDDPELG